ncbi:response regulator [Myxococcota bacterium]|nr:response regulator [Myxococcota bacterium]
MLRVLVVEDLPDFQQSYRELLEQLGHRCTVASTRGEALSIWRSGQPFDLVLLDKRLQGKGGPDDGLDLFEEARFSSAKVILITAYADDTSIRRAFELGAYDFLEKGPLLRTLLKVKLAQIDELVRARQRGTPESEAMIHELWTTLGEGSNHQRGKKLEELLLRLMTSIPGFQEASTNLRTPSEELDICLRNLSEDPLWRRQPSYLLVECKNWSKAVGTAEIAWFSEKLRRRPDARVGFFVAPEGFSEPVEEDVRLYRARDQLGMILVERASLDRLVREPTTRSEQLAELHARWTLG